MDKTPGQRRTRRISRQQILEAAIDIVDREGLSACNMRRIAQSLGVEAMSLYNHIANKDALLDGMAELVLDTIPLDSDPAKHWQEELRHLAIAYSQTLYTHPALLPVLATRPVKMLTNPPILTRLLATLALAGLADREQRHAVNALAGMVLGVALQYIGGPHVPSSAATQASTAPPSANGSGTATTAQAEADLTFGLDTFIQGLGEHSRAT